MAWLNVLYCFDSTSWRMAAVSIQSLLSSAHKSTRLRIHCMVAPGTSEYKQIKQIIKSRRPRTRLIWQEVPDTLNPFAGCPLCGPVNFYPCIAHRFFKKIDKILYLGNNTLVFHDLTELFNTDISQHVFAAIYDMAPINNRDSTLGTQIKDFSARYLNGGPYYNTGVLLINLAQMIEHERLMFSVRAPLRYPEQDILNVAFAGKIKTLPLRYNLAPGIGVPSHFTQTDVAQINAGQHVIVNCYYTRAYDKARMNHLVYNRFSVCAKNIGMDTETFINGPRPPEEFKDTYIPFLKTKGKRFFLFGIEIK